MTTEDPLHRVRLAAPSDEGELVDMIWRMHGDEEWGLRDAQGAPFPFDGDKARFAVRRATQEGKAWVGIVGEPGHLEGSVYLTTQELSLSRGQILVEAWNWVDPEYRSGDAFAMLTSFSMTMADTMGLSLTLAAMTRERAAKGRLYERKIGRPTASLYQYHSQMRAVA